MTTSQPPTPSPPSARLAPDSIFHSARAIANPAARVEFLDRACHGDAALRAGVEALLAADAEAGGFLATSDLPTASNTTDRSGTRIGPYKLLQRIGEGGFGTVYLAEQDAPVRRKVALKVIAPGMDSKQVVGRFEAERQALALMEHPHIARVFDGGLTPDSRPYFVMEYVVGDAITAFADAHKLNVPERLELFQQVCHAVQHAHTKGIIHRDLKPGNILVSMTDGKPFAKVIDFGIAKATGAAGGRLSDKTYFTEHRQLMGTPEYMSPEQAEGSADIDTKTDVYALGVLLYELLTGATPFDSKRLRSAAWGEMQRIIKEEEPPTPSLRISRNLDTLASTAAVRRAEPAKLSALVKGELDWIVMKCLEKERVRRYETPSALAADVQHHLSGQAVLAAPPSIGYRLRKFARRNRGPVIAGTLVAGAVILGASIAIASLAHARASDKRAARIGRFMQSTLFGTTSTDDLATNRDVLRELIAGAASVGDLADPKRWYDVQLALRIIEGDWRENPPSTAELTRVLTSQLDALATRGDAAPKDTYDRLADHNARAVLLLLAGKRDDAREVLRGALEMTARPVDRRGRLAHAQQLINDSLLENRLTGRDERLQDALAIYRSELGSTHLETAVAMEELASALYHFDTWREGEDLKPRGREAESLLLECLAIRRGAHNVPPASIARVLTRIADFHKNWFLDSETAAKYLREALVEWDHAYTGDHERKVEVLLNLGRVSAPQEAEALKRDSVAMARRLSPDGSTLLGESLTELGHTLIATGKLREAAEILAESIEITDHIGGQLSGTWGNRVIALDKAAIGLAAVGDFEGAERWLRWIVPRIKDPHNETASRVARTTLHDFLMWIGRTEEGAAVIASSEQYRYPHNDIPFAQRLARELEWLGNHRLESGDLQEAESLFRRQLATCESSQPPLPPQHALLAKANIGRSLLPQGRFGEAAQYLLPIATEAGLPHDREASEGRSNAIERLVCVYEKWNAVEPSSDRTVALAKWTDRLLALNVGRDLGEYLGIENVRTLMGKLSATDTLDPSEFKRVRAFVQMITGEAVDDPFGRSGFPSLVRRAICTVDSICEAKPGVALVNPDKSSINYIVAHAALTVLDNRWRDADAELSRVIPMYGVSRGSPDAIRLLSCQEQVLPYIGKDREQILAHIRATRRLLAFDDPRRLDAIGYLMLNEEIMVWSHDWPVVFECHFLRGNVTDELANMPKCVRNPTGTRSVAARDGHAPLLQDESDCPPAAFAALAAIRWHLGDPKTADEELAKAAEIDRKYNVGPFSREQHREEARKALSQAKTMVSDPTLAASMHDQDVRELIFHVDAWISGQ